MSRSLGISAPSGRTRQIDLEIEPIADGIIVRPHGEIDINSAGSFRAQLTSAQRAHPARNGDRHGERALDRQRGRGDARADASRGAHRVDDARALQPAAAGAVAAGDRRSRRRCVHGHRHARRGGGASESPEVRAVRSRQAEVQLRPGARHLRGRAQGPLEEEAAGPDRADAPGRRRAGRPRGPRSCGRSACGGGTTKPVCSSGASASRMPASWRSSSTRRGRSPRGGSASRPERRTGTTATTPRYAPPAAAGAGPDGACDVVIREADP